MSKRKPKSSQVLFTPLDMSEARQTGKRTFRKQILPLTTITYRGRKVTFDRNFLQSLKDAFDDRAYDQVPLVLANKANEHNMDPERFRGEIKDLELTDSGLDAIVHTTKRGARVIKDNPKLGVSVRVLSNVEKADGRVYPRALNHVLATLDPKATGMTPWQTVDLSTESNTAEVVDMTAAHYKEGNTMAKKKASGRQPQSTVISVPTGKKGKTREIDLSSLSDEEFQDLLDLATEVEVTDEPEGGVIDFTADVDKKAKGKNPFATKTKGKKGETPVDDPKDAKVKGKKGEIPAQFAKKGTKKAKTKGKGVDSESRLVSLSNRVAENDWRRERRDLVLAGVPPHMLDLAEPVLATAEPTTLDLSNTKKGSVDAAGIMRDMLHAAKGYIKVNPEVGHQIDLSEVPDSAADALAKAWDNEYGDASITI